MTDTPTDVDEDKCEGQRRCPFDSVDVRAVKSWSANWLPRIALIAMLFCMGAAYKTNGDVCSLGSKIDAHIQYHGAVVAPKKGGP